MILYIRRTRNQTLIFKRACAYQCLENLHFGLEALPVLDLGPGNSLNGPLLVGVIVDSHVNLTVRAFSESLHEQVVRSSKEN